MRRLDEKPISHEEKMILEDLENKPLKDCSDAYFFDHLPKYIPDLAYKQFITIMITDFGINMANHLKRVTPGLKNRTLGNLKTIKKIREDVQDILKFTRPSEKNRQKIKKLAANQDSSYAIIFKNTFKLHDDIQHLLIIMFGLEFDVSEHVLILDDSFIKHLKRVSSLLTEDEYERLMQLHKVRNMFAHNVDIFEQKSINESIDRFETLYSEVFEIYERYYKEYSEIFRKMIIEKDPKVDGYSIDKGIS